ncbi:hypothetical protein Q4577_10025 [Marinovum sp. 2_MG-2023]|nr:MULTISPECIES: hypothetical protein [Roseobacteraceae]MCJ7871938.1 hypothetical protein [Phaeobacter sp. J2-8]MDO6730357.1 hypothetical protein [Marinovum sp. 2_MG-2023]MDO6778337.1 hypothetical protein [Marinovum sp. 1_MG-2023]
MTNTIALYLAVFLLAAIGADFYLFGTEHSLFLAKKFLDLLEWLSFWR